MKKEYRRRGILNVRADATDPKTVLAELHKAWGEFQTEQRAAIAELKAKGGVDPLLTEKIEKISASVSALEAMKQEIEQMKTVIARGEFPGGGAGVDPAKREHAKAFDRWFRKGIEGNLAELEVQAGLKTGSDPDGGYFAPEEMDRQIERVAGVVSAMRGLARVMSISTDTYKKLVNQGGASSGWVGETGSRTETNTPTLKEIVINTKEIYANPAATQSLLDDSSVDIAAWLADEVNIEFAEKEADAFINGNGVEKPRGILNYTAVANANYTWGSIGYIATGAASTFANYTKLVDLEHALKSVYRNGATFLMSDATFAHCRKFQDGDGLFIWRPGMEIGAPSTLLGKPVAIDDNMPSIGAGNYPIAFANFPRAYLIVDRLGVRVLRDPYTNKPYVHFYTTKRVGGGVVMYEAIKLLKVAAS